MDKKDKDPVTHAWGEMEKNAQDISLSAENPKGKKLFDF